MTFLEWSLCVVFFPQTLNVLGGRHYVWNHIKEVCWFFYIHVRWNVVLLPKCNLHGVVILMASGFQDVIWVSFRHLFMINYIWDSVPEMEMQEGDFIVCIVLMIFLSILCNEVFMCNCFLLETGDSFSCFFNKNYYIRFACITGICFLS